jgi:hypothetical protein
MLVAVVKKEDMTSILKAAILDKVVMEAHTLEEMEDRMVVEDMVD